MFLHFRIKQQQQHIHIHKKKKEKNEKRKESIKHYCAVVAKTTTKQNIQQPLRNIYQKSIQYFQQKNFQKDVFIYIFFSAGLPARLLHLLGEICKK